MLSKWPNSCWLLLGMTLTWFAPLLKRQSPLLNDLDAFVEEFNTTFGDFDKKCRSISKLQALCQGPCLVVCMHQISNNWFVTYNEMK
jgi:hypothetical protein